MKAENTIGLQKMQDIIRGEYWNEFTYELVNPIDAFFVSKQIDSQYIQPIFSVQQITREDATLLNSNVVFISAAGATGKSAMTNYLSYKLKAPIFDLSKYDTIASNTLTGLLFKHMQLADCMSFVTDLKDGRATMIVDALDEGFIKTNTTGFFNFLDDVASLTTNNGISFIILGRTGIVDLAILYMEMRGKNVCKLQIEPFTITQAKEFIDVHTDCNESLRYSKSYKECRDLIIQSIEGFFESTSDVKNKQLARFIGYAPVLLAISKFLSKNKNFRATNDMLMSTGKKNVALIVEIVESILSRDKEEKINKNVLPMLLKNRVADVERRAFDLSYGYDEQCARILYRCMGKAYSYPIIGDEYFDTEYNRIIDDWMNDHPFLSERKIANIVFESYILARLVRNERFREDVYEYLRTKYTHSYMFFYMYNQLNANSNKIVPKEIVPYLFASLQALDRKNAQVTMDIHMPDGIRVLTDRPTLCPLTFDSGEGENEVEFEFQVAISRNDTLNLLPYLTNVVIDLPINVSLSAARIELQAPVYISCKDVNITTSEILVGNSGIEECVTIEADNLYANPYELNQQIVITNSTYSNSSLQLATRNKLSFPFVDYSVNKYENMNVSPDIEEKYHKMRRLLLMFRSNGKGKLARYQEKIDNLIGGSEMGSRVLSALIKEEVIYSKGCLYFIDSNKLSMVLGISYDEIRSQRVRTTVARFLSKI